MPVNRKTTGKREDAICTCNGNAAALIKKNVDRVILHDLRCLLGEN